MSQVNPQLYEWLAIFNDRSSIDSISDLFALVKRYDKDFSPKDVNLTLLNADGKPKVFCREIKRTLATPISEQAPINTLEANSGTDSSNSIPEIKENVNTQLQCLYLAVSLAKIEVDVMGDTMLENQASTRLLPVSNISIPQLIEKITRKTKNGRDRNARGRHK